MHYRLARREQAARIAVALGGWQVENNVLENFLRRLESKGCRVADVQLENAMAFFLKALGVPQNGSADVVTDIGQFVGLANLHGAYLVDPS